MLRTCTECCGQDWKNIYNEVTERNIKIVHWSCVNCHSVQVETKRLAMPTCPTCHGTNMRRDFQEVTTMADSSKAFIPGPWICADCEVVQVGGGIRFDEWAEQAAKEHEIEEAKQRRDEERKRALRQQNKDVKQTKLGKYM